MSQSTEDRWATYLEECERSIGRPLTIKLFGTLAQLRPGLSRGLGWSVSADDDPADDYGDDESAADPHRPWWCGSGRPSVPPGGSGSNG